MLNDNYKNIFIEFTTWLHTLGFSSAVVYDYKFRVKDFFTYLQEQNILGVHVINDTHVHNYFDYLQTRKNKRRTGALSISHLNHNFMAIDKLLEYLHQIGFSNTPVPTNYRIKPDTQARINNIQVLTTDDIKLLFDNVTNPKLFIGTYYSYAQKEKTQQQLKLILALYYGCGLRRMEAYKLTINDIDFDKKTIFIQQGKNYKDRIVPMNETVYKVLLDYVYNFRVTLKLNHKRLFVIDANNIALNLNKLVNVCDSEHLKNKKITLHILRHSIATHLLQNGMSIENIALFLGHSSLESTQIYTHLK
jgi:integrase/recombinase XerD